MSKPRSAVVIGAGLSGLATAWELQRRGVQVRLLESRGRVGGVIQTELRSGFVVDVGPSEMLLKSQQVEDTLLELGLGSRMQVAQEKGAKRYIVRSGSPVPVPGNPLQGAFSPLFSIAGKVRLLKEFRIPRGSADDESVADFVRRRVGQEFLDYAVAPLVSGIFAGDPDCLSMRHAFPKIWDLERKHGGLMRGALAKRREARQNPQPRYKSKLISFEGGMSTLPNTIAGRLGDCVSTGAQLLSVQRDDDAWKVVWRSGEQVSQALVDYVVLATPAHAVRSLPLPGDMQRALAAVDEVRYSPVATLFLGYHRDQVRHPLDGFGMLVPRREDRRILGTLFLSSLFPGRAPEGHVSLLTFVGGMTAPDRAALPPPTIEQMARDELAALLGVRGEPALAVHHHWPRAIPQYELGYQRILNRIDRAEELFSGLAVVGNFRSGPGAGDCLASARATAERLTR